VACCSKRQAEKRLAFRKLGCGGVSFTTLTKERKKPMALIRYPASQLETWSPFERLASLRDEMNRLFEGRWPLAAESNLFSGWTPPLDIYQTKDHVLVRLELPGMKKEDFDISLHNGTLSISGERKAEQVGEGSEPHRSERFFGRFHRSVTLPTTVDPKQVSATYKDGILEVRLGKAEEAKPKQIEVKVG
jgi:HSP20 family protein